MVAAVVKSDGAASIIMTDSNELLTRNVAAETLRRDRRTIRRALEGVTPDERAANGRQRAADAPPFEVIARKFAGNEGLLVANLMGLPRENELRPAQKRSR